MNNEPEYLHEFLQNHANNGFLIIITVINSNIN